MNKQRKVSTKISIGVRFDRSLRDFPCDDFGYYCTLFMQYDQHGTLPFPGSLSEQPNFIIEVFNTLKALVTEVKENALKESQPKK